MAQKNRASPAVISKDSDSAAKVDTSVFFAL